MKVSRPGSIVSQSSQSASRPTGGFAVSSGAHPASASAATPTAGAASIASVAALLALQEDDGPEARRRKALKRGNGLLDRLDAVKIALLDGGNGAAALQALARAAAEERHGDPDPGLQDVLDHIETRAAVEIAKARRQAVG